MKTDTGFEVVMNKLFEQVTEKPFVIYCNDEQRKIFNDLLRKRKPVKLLDLIKSAVANKQHIHRVPGNTRAGKQLRSRNSTRDIIQTGQGKHDTRLAESIKGTNGKRNI